MSDRNHVTSAAFILLNSSNVFLLSSHTALVVALSLASTDNLNFAIGCDGFGRTRYCSSVFAINIFSGSVRNNCFCRESGVLQDCAQNIRCWKIRMSSLTSGFPGIGNTGPGDAAYISGLVMMDVMLSWWKGRSGRCCRWDRPFYLLSLLLGNSCRSDWRVTTLVPFDSLFYLLCISYLFVTRGLKDLCVVADGSVRFLLFPIAYLRCGAI